MLSAALAGCSGVSVPDVARLTEPAPEIRSAVEGPPDAAPGTCWARDVTPAVVETVTDEVLVQPAQITDEGTLLSPPLYRNETAQRIVSERREIWFETPCELDLTPDFVASLQRALAARGTYTGPITGEMDARTRRAVRAFQAPQGLDSGILSMAAARSMGLVVDPGLTLEEAADTRHDEGAPRAQM